MLSRPIAPASPRALRAVRIALLWLAFAMAMAQLVAVRHAYSHTPGEATTQSGGKHPGGLAHCDACIAVVALVAGAPPPVALVVTGAAHQLPLPTAPALRSLTAQQRPYAIRAPPSIAG